MPPRPPIAERLWNTVPPEAQAAIAALSDSLERRIAELEAENADLRRRLAQLEHDIQTIRQRGKRTSDRRHDPNSPRTDRRRKGHRKHSGFFRPEPPAGTVFTEHDVHPQQCLEASRRVIRNGVPARRWGDS
jgi:hypothetical protein